MISNPEYLGGFITFYRKRIGLSQVKLAKVLKASAQNLGLYELGKKVPDRKYLDRLYSGMNKYVEENQIEIIR